MVAELAIHRGGRVVSREELNDVVVPPNTSTWFPIGHTTVLEAVEKTLGTAGFQVSRSRFSLSNRNARFFGVLDLVHQISDAGGGVNLAVGVRNSIDKSFPIGFCCGSRVFVCDNLAFTSEIICSRKHTRFGETRYLEGISKAVMQLAHYADNMANWIENARNDFLTDDAANSYMLQAYEKKIVSSRLLPLVIKEWREPHLDEYKPRNRWALWNCFTDVIGRKQKNNPQEAALSTMRLQRLLT